MILRFSVIALFVVWLGTSGCVTVAPHPCVKGGQSARDDGKIGKGTKQCFQQKDRSGRFVNHGKYVEWYPNGKRALEGEYESGVKVGKWSEWDDEGHQLVDKWYESGQPVGGREASPQNGLVAPPRQTPLLNTAPPLLDKKAPKS